MIQAMQNNLTRLPVCLALLATLCLSVNSYAQESEEAAAPAINLNVLDSIVAVVEEDVILHSELDTNIDTVKRQIEARGSGMPPEDLLRRQVLERLIVKKLQVQRAESTGIRVSDSDVDATLQRVAQQNNISVAQLRSRLETDGFEFSEFRNEMREELIIGRLRDRVMGSGATVSDTEVDILLASERFGGGQINVSQILVSLPEGASPTQVQKARDKVEDVYQRLQNGLDFSAAAISYSDAADALEGGLIGWRDANTVPTMFADALTSLQPGDISPPIRSPSGFHILRLNDRRDNQQVMIDEVKAQHLMIEVTELVSARDAMELIQEIKQQIDNGEDFAALAREHSNDRNSANIGGDLGWFEPQQYGMRFEQTLNAMQPGDVSEPFQSSSGWHILKLNDRRTADVTDLAIRSRAREMLRQQKGEEEYTRFLRQLRDESYVDVQLADAES